MTNFRPNFTGFFFFFLYNLKCTLCYSEFFSAIFRLLKRSASSNLLFVSLWSKKGSDYKCCVGSVHADINQNILDGFYSSYRQYTSLSYVEDITQWREEMDFIFECSSREDEIHIFKPPCSFFFIYRFNAKSGK